MMKFTNPPIVQYDAGNEDEGPKAHPDPYVLKYNGEYYCFSTEITDMPVLHWQRLYETELFHRLCPGGGQFDGQPEATVRASLVTLNASVVHD